MIALALVGMAGAHSPPSAVIRLKGGSARLRAETALPAGGTMEFGEEVFAAIEAVTREPEVRANHELALFDLQVLDSLRTIMLGVGLNPRFGVAIPPSRINPQASATPPGTL